MYRSYCFYIVFILFSTEVQAQQILKADTTIVIENCLEKTTIKQGNSTEVWTKILNCFWDSDTDTTIVIDDCVKKVTFHKMGYKKIHEIILPCYWDDATKQVDTFLIPKQDDKWSIKYITHYTKPNGETKTGKTTIGIISSDTYRAGLDTVARQEYSHSHQVFKQYSLIKRYRGIPVSVRDTTINKQSVLERVNQIRLNYCQCGNKKMNPTTTLKWSDKLAYVAYLHAKDMYKRKYFDHISPEGEDPGDRIRKSGIEGISWRGENIAWGDKNGLDAVESWKESPGHCKNMMNPNHKHVGVGKYMDKYVMLLGSER
jgi:uncharacterized protein YkwD